MLENPLKSISNLLRRELSEISSLKREAAEYLGMYPFWGFWIGAAVVASLIGFIAYKVSSGFQEYVQFIFGEFFLPWWSWSVHHMVPFWDYSPARGLINYLPGFVSAIFFDGTTTSFEAANSFVAAFYLLLCYPIVAKCIGVFPAFIAFLLMPLANGFSEIAVLMTAASCVLCETYLTISAAMWLLILCSVGVTAVLAGSAQGGLLVLATMPLKELKD